MDEQRHRDDVIDRELTRAFRGPAAAPSAPHLDAEAAAAWMEQRLDATDASAIDAHLAGCAECQAMVATLARISPEPDAAVARVASWWERTRGRWLAPVALAAAALVIWVSLPQRVPTPPQQESVQARAEAPAPPAATLELEPAPASPAAPGTRERFELRTAPSVSVSAEATAPSDAPRADALNDSIGANVQIAGRATVADGTPAPPLPPPPSPAPAAAQPEAAQAKMRASAPDARALSERTFAAVRRQEIALTIVAADGGARWRLTGGAIEFARRADAAFMPATVPGDSIVAIAGSAPGGTICWIVGPGRLVLVTSDGARFVQISPPATAAAGFTAVAATDARTAIVTAADGRRFRTADQGASWAPAP